MKIFNKRFLSILIISVFILTLSDSCRDDIKNTEPPTTSTTSASTEQITEVNTTGSRIFTVSFDLNGSDGMPINSVQVNEGKSVALKNIQRSGHKFVGWFDAVKGGNLAGLGRDSYQPAGDITLYAYWEEIKYTGRDYYISNSGSESGNGSIKNPFKKISQLNEIEFGPGDRIFFEKGGVWLGERFRPQGSGTELQPIIVDSYGSSSINPVIDAQGYDAQGLDRGTSILIDGIEYWTFKNLTVRNTNEDGSDLQRRRQGILAVCLNKDYSYGDGYMRGIILDSLEVCDIYAPSNRDPNKFDEVLWDSGGIFIRTWESAPVGFKDFQIINCYIHDVKSFAVYVNAEADNLPYEGLVMRNDVIRNTGTDAVQFIIGNAGAKEGSLIEYCGIFDTAYNSKDSSYTGAVYGGNSLIQYNEIGRVKYDGDSMAFDCDMGAYGTAIFQYNYTHGCEGGVFMNWGSIDEGSFTDLNVYRYNISQNDGLYNLDMPLFKLWKGNNLIYNNVICNDIPVIQRNGKNAGYKPIVIGAGDPATGDSYFYNNIFYSLADTDYDSYLNSSVIMDNNCYFGPNRPNIKVTDSNGIFADPMFASPGSAPSDGTEIRNLAELCKGYMLKDGSPLVRAGKTITTDSIMKMFPNANRSLLESADLGIDFFGNPLRKDSPAIGVYEPVPVN